MKAVQATFMGPLRRIAGARPLVPGEPRHTDAMVKERLQVPLLHALVDFARLRHVGLLLLSTAAPAVRALLRFAWRVEVRAALHTMQAMWRQNSTICRWGSCRRRSLAESPGVIKPSTTDSHKLQ